MVAFIYVWHLDLIHGCANDHVLAILEGVGLAWVDYRDVILFSFVLGNHHVLVHQLLLLAVFGVDVEAL